jgi:acyl carrier protein
VERAFSVTLSARDVLRVTTLGHLVDILEQHRAGG